MKTQDHRPARVIGLSGPIKAGKSAVARILCEMAGFSRLSFGQLVLERVKAAGSTPTRELLQVAGTQLIHDAGYDGITDLLLQKMDSNPLQVIEGVRHAGVDSYLRGKFGHVFKLVYVDCPFEPRYQRARTENPELSAEAFRSQDEAPIEQGTRALREIAEVVLLNDKGIDDLTKRVRELL